MLLFAMAFLRNQCRDNTGQVIAGYTSGVAFHLAGSPPQSEKCTSAITICGLSILRK